MRRPELEDLELLDQDPVERVHPRADVERRQDFLLHRRADGRQARGDEVGELAGIGDVGGERLQIVGQQRRERHHLLEVALDVALQRVDLEVVLVAQLIRRRRSPRARRYGRVWTMRSSVTRADTLDDQAQAAVGQLEHLVDVRRGADRIQVFLHRLFDRRFALGEDADQAGRTAFASSTRRTDASRATASGMNELGNRTVSRSGSTGQFGGIWSDRSSVLDVLVRRVGRASLRVCHRIGLPLERRLPDFGQPCMSMKSDAAPRRCAIRRSRCCLTSRASSQSLQRTANGSARSRRSLISSPHSKQ